MFSEQTSPNKSNKFRLKHMRISHDTKEIVLHVIKQCLQAVHHSCKSLVHGLHQNVTVIISQMISRKCAE